MADPWMFWADTKSADWAAEQFLLLTDSRHPVCISRPAWYWWIRTGESVWWTQSTLRTWRNACCCEAIEYRASALTLVSVRSRQKQRWGRVKKKSWEKLNGDFVMVNNRHISFTDVDLSIRQKCIVEASCMCCHFCSINNDAENKSGLPQFFLAMIRTALH